MRFFDSGGAMPPKNPRDHWPDFVVQVTPPCTPVRGGVSPEVDGDTVLLRRCQEHVWIIFHSGFENAVSNTQKLVHDGDDGCHLLFALGY